MLTRPCQTAAYRRSKISEVLTEHTITTITERVMEGMADWQSRPLDPVYAVIFIDAINVKIREGQVANRPTYLGRPGCGGRGIRCPP